MWTKQEHTNGRASKVPADRGWRFSGLCLREILLRGYYLAVTDIHEVVEADGNGWTPGVHSYHCFLCKQRIGAVFSLENGLLKWRPAA